MKSVVQRTYFRSGQLHEETTLVRGQLHGRQRRWHSNGQLAHEGFYSGGLLHGLSRSWNEQGELLGQFTMERGTGTFRSWIEEGTIQFECGMFQGTPHGLSRAWLADGSLAQEDYFLDGVRVSRATYAKARSKDSSLPKLPRARRSKLPTGLKLQKLAHNAFVKSLLRRKDSWEAIFWLSQNKVVHLGKISNPAKAWRLIEDLYRAGAKVILVVKPYGNTKVGGFCDALLIGLPKNRSQRLSLRKTYQTHPLLKKVVAIPVAEQGETHHYLKLV